jgi:hypothetical protein
MNGLAALLLLASCASQPCPWDGNEIEPPADVEVVYKAWRERYGKMPKLCYETPEAYRYDAWDWCPRDYDGCLTTWLGETHICRGILLRSRYVDNACMYAHELTHWLLFCTGAHLDGQPLFGDARHQHPAWREQFLGPVCQLLKDDAT